MRKFIFIDPADNREKEAFALEPGDLPDRLTTKRKCSEVISALKLVRSDDSIFVSLADNSTYAGSKVLGLALQGGNIGDDIEVLLFGLEEDPFFNFSLDAPLFLGSAGAVIDIPPTIGYSVTVANSLGSGAIFLSIEEPTRL